MSVREYIGARYVPLFADPIQWDNTKTYEPLTVVTDSGNSYTSRQYVPAGIDIANTAYWALTGNYNAQIEAYRAEVETYDNRITAVENKFPIGSLDIDDGAIDGAKIANGAVNTADIADGAVTTAKIDDGAVTDDKIDSSVLNRIRSKAAAISGTNMVVFGDSYTAPNIANSIDAYWPKRVATAYNLTLFNYAIAGAGFGRTAQLISVQQTNCQNAMTQEQAENTSVVVCLAGCNDLLNDVAVADINSGIANFISWAATFFPYADIYVVPYNWGFSKLTQAHNYLITNSMNSIMVYNKTRIHIVPYAWCWNLGIASRFQNEMHPNQTGYQHIAAMIMSAIEGCGDAAFGVGSSNDMSGRTGINSGYFAYNVRNGIVYINGYVRPSADGAAAINLYASGNGPAICTPYTGTVFSAPLNNSTQLNDAGVITIESDGRIHVNFNSSVHENDVCSFNFAFLPEVGVNWSDYI